MPEIELHTRVRIDALPFSLDYSTGIVSLGSCFSDEMGERLAESGFHVDSNPFGTLYNPASIASALRRIMYDSEITVNDLVEHEGLWHSWHHHGSFSRPTPEECLDACNNRIHLAHQNLKQATLLMITFGTAWIFELPDRVVANCHKLPQQMFHRRRMTVDDITALWRPLLEELHACYPTLHTLFTVSPIRHLGDGLHGNQLSKSTLLLAIDELVDSELPKPRKKRGGKQLEAERPYTVYFPAYEVLLDELRDYRFFGNDMAHPSTLGGEVVWDRFQRATMCPAVRDQAHFNHKQSRRDHHIPLH